MITPEMRNLGYSTGWAATVGFCSGWCAGTALMAGGKLWTLMTNSNKKVSDLMGHIGTPTFRRELVVGAAVACVTLKVFHYLTPKWSTKKSLAGKAYSATGYALAIAAGSLAASAINHSNYKSVMYPLAIGSGAMVIYELYLNSKQ